MVRRITIVMRCSAVVVSSRTVCTTGTTAAGTAIRWQSTVRFYDGNSHRLYARRMPKHLTIAAVVGAVGEMGETTPICGGGKAREVRVGGGGGMRGMGWHTECVHVGRCTREREVVGIRRGGGEVRISRSVGLRRVGRSLGLASS